VRLLLGRGGSGTLERIVDVDPAPAQHTLSRQRGRGGFWHGTAPAQHTLSRRRVPQRGGGVRLLARASAPARRRSEAAARTWRIGYT